MCIQHIKQDFLKALQKIALPKFMMDVISLSGSRFFNLGMGFVTGVMVARLLGPDRVGVVTSTLVIPGIVLSFSDLGLRQAITHYMGKKIYPDQKIISMVPFLILVTSTIGIAFSLAGYLITSFGTRYGWTAIIIGLSFIPISLTLDISSGIFMAKREIKKISLIVIIPTIIQFLIVAFFFILQNASVEWQLVIRVGSSFFAAMLALFYLKKYGSLRPIFLPDMIWVMLKKGVIYAAALFMISLNYQVDVVILGRLTNSAEVGVYSVGVTVANMLWLIPNVLNMVNFSHSASSKDSMKYAHKTALLLRMVLWVSLIPFAFLYFLSPYLIPWIYGTGYVISGLVVQAILPGVWAMLIFKILHSDLAGRGTPAVAFWVYLTAAAINIIFNLWWDPIYGAIGAAWASTVSYTVGGLLYAIVYARISNLTLGNLFLINKQDIQDLIHRQCR